MKVQADFLVKAGQRPVSERRYHGQTVRQGAGSRDSNQWVSLNGPTGISRAKAKIMVRDRKLRPLLGGGRSRRTRDGPARKPEVWQETAEMSHMAKKRCGTGEYMLD